jgi:biotin carboxylase
MSDVMIIGAGRGQLRLIQKTRALGHRAIVVSCPGPYPGLKEADHVIDRDIRDVDELARMARDRGVAAVVTDQSNVCVRPAATIAERCGLPGVPLSIALLFTDKWVVHELCTRRGIRTPRCRLVHSPTDLARSVAELGLPVVLKPVDNDASRGVQVLRDASDLKRSFAWSRRWSTSGLVLAEEYLSGPQIAVDALLHRGRVLNLVAGTTEPIGLDGLLVPGARMFPASLPAEMLARAYEANTQLYRDHGDFFALVHAEYILSEPDGEPYLIDAHIRGGGAYVMSHVVPLVTGLDPYDLYLRWACGELIALPERIEHRRYAGYVCFLLPEGRLLDAVDAAAVARTPGVEYCDLTGLYAGAAVAPSTDKGSRFGPIIVSAASPGEWEAVRRNLERIICPRVQTAAGVKGPLWR